jgi:DHA1 family tetracycline resistance protein-like MFS transporter
MSTAPAPPPAGDDGRRQAAMPFIMITVLIDMMSIGLIVPVLPVLVGGFTSSQTEQAWWYGAVALCFSVANFISSPLLGALSDRFGRRPVLLVGFCALSLSFFVTALATQLWMLMVVRVFSGAMQSNASVANAYVADITAPVDRAKRFGLLGAMFGIGFILGPVTGGLLGAIDVHLPFFAAGSLALVNLLYGWLVLPESLPPERRKPIVWRTALNPVSALNELRNLSGVGALVAVVACAALSQFILYTSWVLYTTFKFGWGPQQNGWWLFTVGVLSTLVQGFLLGRLLKRFTPQRLAVVGLFSSALSYVAYGAATEGWMLFVIIIVNLFGFTVAASIQSIISSAADASTQGRTMGAVSGLQSLMAVVAPVLSAPLLGVVSHLPRGDWRIGAPFYFCGLVQFIGLGLAWTHFNKARQARMSAAAPIA